MTYVKNIVSGHTEIRADLLRESYEKTIGTQGPLQVRQTLIGYFLSISITFGVEMSPSLIGPTIPEVLVSNLVVRPTE